MPISSQSPRPTPGPLAPPIIPKKRDPAFPQFLFEYHPHTKRVYVTQIPGTWDGPLFTPALTGEAKAGIIAEHCDDEGKFFGHVQSFLRGFRKCAAMTLGPAAEYVTNLAQTQQQLKPRDI